MNKIKKNICLALSFIIMMSIFIIPNSTFAYEKNKQYAPGFSTKADLIKFLKENQVPKEKQEGLLNKIENNQVWDANNPEKQKSIPESFYIFDPKDGSQVRYYRFEDGSFIKIDNTLNEVIEIDGSEKSNKRLKEKVKDKNLLNKILSNQPNQANESKSISISSGSEFTTYGVSSGTGYSHYYDYKVSMWAGSMYASMITEFVVVNGGNDYLIPSGFYGPTASGFGELGQMPTIEIVRTTEDSSRSRWAIANSHWYVNYPISTPWGGSTASGTKYLWIGVGNNTYRVSDRLPY